MASSTLRSRMPSSNRRSSSRSRVRWEVMPIPLFNRSSRTLLYPQIAQPAIEPIEHLVVGLVDAQRGDGDVTVHHRIEIRALTTVLGVTSHRDPVTLLATGVSPLHRPGGTLAMAKTGQHHALDTVQRQIGNVHIEYGARRQIQLLVSLDQRPGDCRGCRQVVGLATDQGEGHGRSGQEAALQRGSYRARVEYVIAQVRSEEHTSELQS